MALSKYHQTYINQRDEEIQRKADAKEQELIAIFNEIPFISESDPVSVAVLGCGDKRFVAYHKRIFEHVLEKNIIVTTFDITIDHLKGELNIIQHDCTQPLPDPPFDITYSHVLLKFIETKKQFDLLIHSFYALKTHGVAIHIFDWDEIQADNPRLPNDFWAVPLEQWKEKLGKHKIENKEIILPYGPALILLRK